MGYKISMISVKQPASLIREEDLLLHLGFKSLVLSGSTTLDACMYPLDKSVNIGVYNSCILICDDYQLTNKLETPVRPEVLSDYEKILSALYPGSEILTVACHSVVNYHMYSLVKDGKKIRFKTVSSDGPVQSYGEELEEEKEIYAQSTIINGERLFRDPRFTDQFEYHEDELMEDFTFKVAARHLGVDISMASGEELLSETLFKKYLPATKKANQSQKSWFSRLFGK